MSLGSRFDAWLTTDPRDNYREVEPHTCYDCDEELDITPDFSTDGETTAECTGQYIGGHVSGKYIDRLYDPSCGETPEHETHIYTTHAWTNNHHVCNKCFQDNVIVDV